MLGHSIGELACGYADSCLTREQTLEVAVLRGRCVENSNLPKGAMVATGLTWEKAMAMCPEGVVPACHNAGDSVTISGGQKEVRDFLKVLTAKNVFAKELDTNEVAFHSHMIECVKSKFEESVRHVIPKPAEISKTWVSTSVPKDKRNMPHAKTCSPEHLANNLCNPVLFHDALQQVPKNAVVIEIAPHCLLQATLKRSLVNKQTIFGLMRKQDNGSLYHFMKTLGNLWMTGVNIDVTELQQKAAWPVAQGTQMISPLISWDHSETWAVPATEAFIGGGIENAFRYNIDVSDLGEYGHLKQHVINGRAMFPATGFLVLVWKAFATSLKKTALKTPITFGNVRIHRPTLLLEKELTVCLAVYLYYESPEQQNFSIVDSNGLIATGAIEELVDTTLTEELCPTVDEKELIVQKSEVYLELDLQGSAYGPSFQGIGKMDPTGRFAELEWKKDWITFLDLFFQFPILAVGKRGLNILTTVGTFMIDPTKFEKVTSEEASNKVRLVAYYNMERQSISLNGIYVDRAEYNSMHRRHDTQSPKLSAYKFEPYIRDIQSETKHGTTERGLNGVLNTGMNTMIEANVQDIVAVVSENTNVTIRTLFVEDSKNIEIFKSFLDECYNHETPVFVSKFESDENDSEGVDCKNTPFIMWGFGQTVPKSMMPFDLVVLDEVLYNQERSKDAVEQLVGIVNDGGFVVVREALCQDVNQKEHPKNPNDHFKGLFKQHGLITVAQKPDGHNHFMFVLRKTRTMTTEERSPVIINANGKKFKWLQELQSKLKEPENMAQRIWLLSDDNDSGLVGLVNCLRKEPGGQKIRCLVNLDGPSAATVDALVQTCIPPDLVMNVFQNGIWGSFKDREIKDKLDDAFSFVEIEHPGDMSTLKWSLSPLTSKPEGSELMVFIHFASLNFRDIMLASGKLPMNAVPCGLNETEGKLGMEFSGVDMEGRRVMGLCEAQGLATTVCAKPDSIFPVPDHWSLEEAATVPVAYSTAYYALILRGGMEGGESILIHSGSGALGQAAITLALHYNCDVFVTVGNKEKRAFLLNKFPALKSENIFSSRNIHFEKYIKEATQGRGMGNLYDNAAILGVHLDSLYKCGGKQVAKLRRLVKDGLDSGVIQPLNTVIFPRADVEKAFRHMTQGTHIGKILVQVRHGDSTLLPASVSTPRITFNPNKSYIITGGLGGLGLEIAEWMVIRGAKHLVLVSRSGVRTGYQKRKIQYLTNKGASVTISRRNICDLEDTKHLMTEVQCCVGGVFHLAGILQDKLFDSMDASDFKVSCDPKITAALNLDMATRLCKPHLDYFVVTSSIAANFGSAGQTNYGYANSAMERLCERRKREGLPGLAIQFGMIADVGMAAAIHKQVDLWVGTSHQSVASCLASLDKLLSQSDPVVTSFVKASTKKETLKGISFSETVFRVMGVNGVRIQDDAKLSDLGLDSLSVLEVKQLLDRRTDTISTTQAVKAMTVQDIKRLD